MDETGTIRGNAAVNLLLDTLHVWDDELRAREISERQGRANEAADAPSQDWNPTERRLARRRQGSWTRVSIRQGGADPSANKVVSIEPGETSERRTHNRSTIWPQRDGSSDRIPLALANVGESPDVGIENEFTKNLTGSRCVRFGSEKGERGKQCSHQSKCARGDSERLRNLCIQSFR